MGKRNGIPDERSSAEQQEEKKKLDARDTAMLQVAALRSQLVEVRGSGGVAACKGLSEAMEELGERVERLLLTEEEGFDAEKYLVPRAEVRPDASIKAITEIVREILEEVQANADRPWKAEQKLKKRLESFDQKVRVGERDARTKPFQQNNSQKAENGSARPTFIEERDENGVPTIRMVR